MKTWKTNYIIQITIPKELGYALVWEGGISNVIGQVVKVNKPVNFGNSKAFETATEKLKYYFTRVNKVDFILTFIIDMNTANIYLVN